MHIVLSYQVEGGQPETDPRRHQMKGLSSVTEVRIEKGRVELPSGEWGVVPEQNRRERGHAFYPPFEDQAVEEKTIYLHYFTGGSDW